MNIEEKYLMIIKEEEKAQKNGDYKTINKFYNKKHKLRNEMLLNINNYNLFFYKLLESNSTYVVLDASIALLKTNQKVALSSLKKLSKQKGLDALTAKMTLQEWKKGNMK